MADFRAHFYARYVSAFKAPPAAGPDAADAAAGRGAAASFDAPPDLPFAWCDHAYLPRLRHLRPDAPILEVGCGDGRLLAYLRRRGFSHARGVDISPEQVALARRRGVQAEVGDAFAFLPAHPAAFDALLLVDVLEHFARSELLDLARLLRGALRPGGLLLVQTANGAGLFAGQVVYGDLTHLTIFTPESLAQLLRPAGFVGLACYEAGPAPIRLRGRLDVAAWAVVKAAANAARRVQAGKRQAIWTDTFIGVARVPRD